MGRRGEIVDPERFDDEQETARYRAMFPGMFPGGEIVAQSAEGITTFGGASADPTGATRKWLDKRYAEMREGKKLQEEAGASAKGQN